MYGQNRNIPNRPMTGGPGLTYPQSGGANRVLTSNTYQMNSSQPMMGGGYSFSQQGGIQNQQPQSMNSFAASAQPAFLNGIRTCKWHKGQVYIAVCSSETCKMGRLCCLRCMVSKHTDHTQNLILLDELRDSDMVNLSVPTNWTSTLGPLKEDIQSIIGLCKVSNAGCNMHNQEEELSKIDDLFDTFTKEIVEDIEKVRMHVKSICKDKNEGSADKLQKLTNTLRKVLSPHDLLQIVDEFIMQHSAKNEALKNSAGKVQNLAVVQSQAEQGLEDELNTFFTTPRMSAEESELVYRNYTFLSKKNPSEIQQDSQSPSYINWNALNDIREQILNIMSNKSRFAEIFFPDSVLFNRFDNLEKVRSITNVYDEITVAAGTITTVEPIDHERFMVIRDSELMEIWNIEQHKKEFSYYIAGAKSQFVPIKTKGRLLVGFISAASNSVQIADTMSKKVIKSFALPVVVKQMKLLSAKDENNFVVDQILLSILLETGEVKIINASKNQIIDLRNKNTAFMEILPEVRCYQQTTGEEQMSGVNPAANSTQANSTAGGIVSSYGLVTASNDLISVWYPLSSKCVRNIKVILRPNETVKQIGSVEMTMQEKQQTYFADSVAGCPSKTAIALLTNKSLRIFNWFKANCVREIPIEDCNNFHVLQTFIQNDLKNIFFLYNVGENKPAEYATCDWSTQKVDYWNSGSLSNFSCVKTLNGFKILEVGKHNIKNSDSKKPNSAGNFPSFEIRARIKSLN